MNFGEYKTMARQAVHDTLAVPSSYSDSTLQAPVPVTVRHHTRVSAHGAADSEYADVLEGINRLVFDRAALAAAGVTLRRGGRVTIPVYGITLELDQREPDDGPVNAYWSVVDAR